MKAMAHGANHQMGDEGIVVNTLSIIIVNDYLGDYGLNPSLCGMILWCNVILLLYILVKAKDNN